MDRNFYYNARAAEHKQEISQGLAMRSLLKEGQRKPLSIKQARRLVLYLAPAVIVIGIMVVLNLFG